MTVQIKKTNQRYVSVLKKLIYLIVMEMELEPRAPWVSQSCREAGTCDYGIYPLSNRFHMDHVPLDLFQFGKASLNPKGAGFCWITGADKKSAKRFGTIQL